MKVLIGTNIVIDALQSRENFVKDADLVVLRAFEYEGYIVSTSVTDIYYIQHKFSIIKKSPRATLKMFFKLFNIIDTTETDCRNALWSSIPDFEYAVLVESVKRNNIDCIVTRNNKNFKNSNMPVCTPTEFLRILKIKLI